MASTMTTVTDAGITITVTRTYTWNGDPATLPASIVGDWTPGGHEGESDALDSLYEALEATNGNEPGALIDWIQSEMDLDDEEISIDEIV